MRRPEEKKTAEYRVSFASAHPAGAVAGGSPGAFRGVPRPRSPPSVFPGPAAKPRGLGSTLRPRGRGPGGRSGSTLRYCSGPTGLRNPGAASCRRAEENSGGIVPPAAFRILTPAVEYHRGFWIRCPPALSRAVGGTSRTPGGHKPVSRNPGVPGPSSDRPRAPRLPTWSDRSPPAPQRALRLAPGRAASRPGPTVRPPARTAPFASPKK